MAYSLQDARRLVTVIALAERLKPPNIPPHAGPLPSGPFPADMTAPLGKPVDIDTPLPGGRWQRLATTYQDEGVITLGPVHDEVDQALLALTRQPPALGAALLATSKALAQIHWEGMSVPTAWTGARHGVLTALALSLDHYLAAAGRLAQARKIVAGLPGGRDYAHRVDLLLNAPGADYRAWRALVGDLDTKIQDL